MADIDSELAVLISTHKGLEMKEAILSALKKLQEEQKEEGEDG